MVSNKAEDLLKQGAKFSFENNSYIASYGTYSRASDELLAWVANIEHFIIENYDENSGPCNLFRTFNKDYLTGYERDDFDKQIAILRGTLMACNQIPPKKNTKRTPSLTIALLNNPFFWTASVILMGASFTLGMHFGTSKFDKEKTELYDENKMLRNEIHAINQDRSKKDSLLQAITIKRDLANKE